MLFTTRSTFQEAHTGGLTRASKRSGSFLLSIELDVLVLGGEKVEGKGKGLDTCYSAAYMSQTHDQQRFTIS